MVRSYDVNEVSEALENLKLTLYLKACEGDLLSGISELSKTFGCSRRQLERVIGKFRREGRLCPVRKGHYEIRR